MKYFVVGVASYGKAMQGEKNLLGVLTADHEKF